jgi:hypothetical protein
LSPISSPTDAAPNPIATGRDLSRLNGRLAVAANMPRLAATASRASGSCDRIPATTPSNPARRAKAPVVILLVLMEQSLLELHQVGGG